ncbi:Uncharacterized protein APZ42_034161 [Daphnia magna]|uniref:Uncharacterized protein n=1 Tax=Daphnia magna TaxID=35525 RepID=A0A164KDS8_9CRUS|nr:Uncharacterized protein APZ42_034161 [Daphnia magna]
MSHQAMLPRHQSTIRLYLSIARGLLLHSPITPKLRNNTLPRATTPLLPYLITSSLTTNDNLCGATLLSLHFTTLPRMPRVALILRPQNTTPQRVPSTTPQLWNTTPPKGGISYYNQNS